MPKNKQKTVTKTLKDFNYDLVTALTALKEAIQNMDEATRALIALMKHQDHEVGPTYGFAGSPPRQRSSAVQRRRPV